MFVEKVKEIKKAEDIAVEKKTNAQSSVKQILSQAHEDGSALIAEAEYNANAKISELLKKAEEEANSILEKARSDARIESVVKKVDAEENITGTVKILIQQIFSDFVQA